MLTRDQWQRIERLFETLEETAPADRRHVLAGSGEEESVCVEVLRMLDASGSGLLDVDLRARPPSAHAPGDLLAGRFRIESLIAEGGMGEVYRAFDTELQIPVALKTIHRILARDNFAIERFKQEVQLARSINHPNVCRIFDLQKQPGKGGADEYFLTMELLDGETLRAFLDRKKILSEHEAVAILDPLLEAMKASHERGVLHLDIKPSNIHLAAVQGQSAPRVVVTDFGLATTSYEASVGDIVSAGTPAYMAPEQFDRQPASPATDIYAAGVVLYEMLCGRLPFTAKTASEMREQKILNQRIPPRQIMPSLSSRLDSALDRTLQPDPQKRFASASEFLVAIRPRTNRIWMWSASAAALLVAVLGGFWLNRPQGSAPLPIRKLTNDSGYSMDPALSPADGSTVVYSSDRGANGLRALWRVRAGGSPVQLTFDDVDSSQPDVSNNGRLIVYRSEREGGGIYVMPSEGGRSTLLAHGGERPRFSPDGQWVLYMTKPATSSQRPQVLAVSVEGRKSANISDGFRDAHNPIWSPDGKYILFCGTRTPGVPSEEHDWWLIDFPLRPGGSRKTGVAVSLNKMAGAPSNTNRLNEDLAAWVGGYLYYVSPQPDSSSVWRVRFDVNSKEPKESPQRLTYGATSDLHPSVTGGKMVFASGAWNLDIWTLPLNANTGKPTGEPKRVTDHMDAEVAPAADAEGRKLVFTLRGTRRELHFLDWQNGTESKLWSEPQEAADQAVWSPDGQWTAFRVLDNPKIRIYLRNIAGERRLVCADCGGPTDWSPDQRHLLYEPGATIAFIGRLDIASGDWTEWIRHPQFSLRGARYSPDGKWIAFHAETAASERRIFIAPNDAQSNDDRWIAVGKPQGSRTVDFMPSWSPDGNLLYFLSQRDGFRCIWAQRLDAATKRPLGEPFEVQHFHRSRRSLLRLVSTRSEQIGFRVYRDRAFFAMDEVTGNLWMADLPK